MKNKIQEITNLLKEGKKKEAFEIYKTFTDEEKAEMQKENSFKSVNGHYYSGFNLFVLSITQEPGTFGTFKQWLENGRCVKKGGKGVGMIVPMIAKGKEDDKVRFFRKITIFAESQTEKLDEEKAKKIKKSKKVTKPVEVKRTEEEKQALELI